MAFDPGAGPVFRQRPPFPGANSGRQIRNGVGCVPDFETKSDMLCRYRAAMGTIKQRARTGKAKTLVSQGSHRGEEPPICHRIRPPL
jgi:hypothetical protein